jgi:2-amino-4-hydroxy-6-hydroxymethyldihydropteridine diphosphokinase
VSEVVLALGSNLGDRLARLRQAAELALTDPVLRDVRCSPVYETEPVGGPAQDDFFNAVLIADTAVSPLDVLRLAQSWEAKAGRERTVHWGPRTLDVDVIAVDAVRSHTPELTLPHPLAHTRAFVLAPWHDVNPDAVLAGHGPVVELLANLHYAGVRRRDDLTLVPEPGDRR